MKREWELMVLAVRQGWPGLLLFAGFVVLAFWLGDR